MLIGRKTIFDWNKLADLIAPVCRGECSGLANQNCAADEEEQQLASHGWKLIRDWWAVVGSVIVTQEAEGWKLGIFDDPAPTRG